MNTKIDAIIPSKCETNNSNLISKLGYIPALDGLRAMAVTMVMFLHAHFF